MQRPLRGLEIAPMQDFRKAEHRILVLWAREEERRQIHKFAGFWLYQLLSVPLKGSWVLLCLRGI